MTHSDSRKPDLPRAILFAGLLMFALCVSVVALTIVLVCTGDFSSEFGSSFLCLAPVLLWNAWFISHIGIRLLRGHVRQLLPMCYLLGGLGLFLAVTSFGDAITANGINWEPVVLFGVPGMLSFFAGVCGFVGRREYETWCRSLPTTLDPV